MAASIHSSDQQGLAAENLPGRHRPPRRRDVWGRWWERNDLGVIVALVGLFLLLVVLWPSMVVIIDSGHAGVYFSVLFGGTDVKWVRGEGFQLKLPWDKIYDYDIRLQQVLYEYSVISADGLLMHFKTSVRFRPRRAGLGVLQQEIGSDYVQKVVIPQTQTALRVVVGNQGAEKIYTTDATILEQALSRAITELTGKFIVVDRILITGINIPEALKNAIDAKLVQQQNVVQYDYVLGIAEKEAKRKRIEAQGIQDFQAIVSSGISENLLRWKGIEATLDLAKSANAKVVVIGAQSGLPLILDTSSTLNGLKTSPTPFLPPSVPSGNETPSPAPTPLHDETHLKPQPSP